MMRLRRVASAASALLAAAALCSEAGGASRVFDKPTEGRYRLDWCLEWANQCGAPAAEAWCRRKGYEGAARFEIDADIGARAPTRVLATGAICAEASCDGFAYIVCTGRDRTGGATAPEHPAETGKVKPPREAPRGAEAGEARGLLQRGFGQLKESQPDQALQTFRRALALERRSGDRRGEARTLAAMGGAYEAMARTKVVGFPDASKPVYDRPELVERAISSLREAAALFQKVGDASGEWHALFNSGVIYENRGEQDRAVDLYRRALAASGAAGERAKVEERIACSTRSGRCPGRRSIYLAFGGVSLIFDEDEWWGE